MMFQQTTLESPEEEPAITTPQCGGWARVPLCYDIGWILSCQSRNCRYLFLKAVHIEHLGQTGKLDGSSWISERKLLRPTRPQGIQPQSCILRPRATKMGASLQDGTSPKGSDLKIYPKNKLAGPRVTLSVLGRSRRWDGPQLTTVLHKPRLALFFISISV